MDSNFKKCLEFVLRWEGGWSPDTKTPGESRMRGISQNTYDRYRYSKSKIKQMAKLISDDEVSDIYCSHFWINSKCPDLDYPVSLIHFDTLIKDGINISESLLKMARDHGKLDEVVVAKKYLELRRQLYSEMIQSNYINYFSKAVLARCNSLNLAILDYENEREKR